MDFSYVFDLLFAYLGALLDFSAFYWVLAAGLIFGSISLMYFILRGDERA